MKAIFFSNEIQLDPKWLLITFYRYICCRCRSKRPQTNWVPFSDEPLTEHTRLWSGGSFDFFPLILDALHIFFRLIKFEFLIRQHCEAVCAPKSILLGWISIIIFSCALALTLIKCSLAFQVYQIEDLYLCWKGFAVTCMRKPQPSS